MVRNSNSKRDVVIYDYTEGRKNEHDVVTAATVWFRVLVECDGVDFPDIHRRWTRE